MPKRLKKLLNRTIAVAIIVFLSLSCMLVDACSSFAIYGEKIYYGMNWDYYTDHDAIFTVNDTGKMKVFTMIDGYEGFSPVGMNSEGLFASMQNVYPEENFIPHDDKLANINMKDLFKQALYNCNNVSQVKTYLQDKRLNYSAVDLHDMIADSKGNAMIAEAGRKSNMITEIEDKFLIMTNFQNYYFKDKKYNEIYAQTSDKYITAYDYMLKNKDDFNIDKGFELLKSIVWTGTYTTRCSFVFDPQDKVVYIAADRNFNKIWKVSIENETIETYKGFEKPMKLNVKWVRLSELKKLAGYDKKTIDRLGEKFIVKPDIEQQSVGAALGIGPYKYFNWTLALWTCLVICAIITSVIILRKRPKGKS